MDLDAMRRLGSEPIAGPAPAGESVRYDPDFEALANEIEKTLRDTGRPIFLSSAILTAGFGLLCLGSFAPSINFGVVSALVTVLALLGDVVLLPILILVVRPRIWPPKVREETTELVGGRR
jgi:hypothetical protein